MPAVSCATTQQEQYILRESFNEGHMRLLKGCSMLFFAMLLVLGVYPKLSTAQQTATISGVITDAADGEALAGATIILSLAGETGIVGGDAADLDGSFSISGIPAGDYTLTVRYVGYSEFRTNITVTSGETATVNAELSQGGLDLNTIVISASRQAEKVLDAPASISVLDAREVERDVVQSTVSVLRNTTGVDMAQTGVDRNEVVLRGFNNAFSGSAYILTDYRQSATPSLNVNLHSIMPNMPIDIERVEVVRGPGSALYGPGVDEGVIHFITKDPFSYPGTTLSLSGGERSLLGLQFRHAGIVGSQFGYKLTGFYSEADDWELDPTSDEDQAFLAGETRERDYGFSKMNFNGTATYRFNDTVSLTANGGYSELSAIVLSGIGTLQADEFSNAYGQLRLQAGRLFAQTFISTNDAGNSFVYGSGQDVVDKGSEFNIQAQYDFDLANERVRMIVGGDYQVTEPDTEGTILGRNEDDDTIEELGGYAQSTIEMTDQLDLTVALRGDWSNIFDFQISPRAALVYKANQSNTFRTSYNRSFSSPGVNSLFLDIVAQRIPVDDTREFLFYGRGSGDGFTFNSFRENNTARMVLPVPFFWGADVNRDAVPLIPIYASAAGGGLIAALTNLEQALPAPINQFVTTDQQRLLLADLLFYTALENPALSPTATTSDGATVLGIPDGSDRGFREVAGPVDIEPLKQTITQTVEVGYKGLINDRVLIAIDGFWSNKKDFAGPLLVESPLVYTQGDQLTVDVATAIGTLFATRAVDPTSDQFDARLAQQLQNLGLAGLDPTAVAQILGALVGGSLNDFQVAVVQPDQGVLPEGTSSDFVGGFLGYRNFGNINYWGVDASVQVLASDELSLFGNVSIISDDFFDNEELDEENIDLSLALNAPTLKLKFGGNYQLASGLSLQASARYTEGFPVLSGPYVGDVDNYFLVDFGAGYNFDQSVPGLRVDFSVQNLLDNEHRQFVGAPTLGRMGILRLTYTIQ